MALEDGRQAGREVEGYERERVGEGFERQRSRGGMKVEETGSELEN